MKYEKVLEVFKEISKLVHASDQAVPSVYYVYSYFIFPVYNLEFSVSSVLLIVSFIGIKYNSLVEGSVQWLKDFPDPKYLALGNR